MQRAPATTWSGWALYCDNYLEGFHIPFIHKGLAASLDWNAYRTELYRWGNCQWA